MSNEVLERNQLYSIEEGEPYASYIKTILSQVGVTVWDNFTNTPAYVVLKGDPKKKSNDSIVDVWSPREDAFFKRNNTRHFEKGIIIPFKRPVNEVIETPIEQYSDEQLREILATKYVTLNKTLNEITSVAVLYRMLSLATEMGKSSKIVDALKAALSELQKAEYKTKEEPAKEEE